MVTGLLDFCLGIVVCLAGYTVMAQPALLPPLRHPPPWRRPRFLTLVQRRPRAPGPVGSRLTPVGLVLGAIGIAAGILLHSPLLAIILGAVGLLAPDWLRRRRYAARRRELLLELGDAVEYLELHFAAGATIPDAIAGTAAFLVGPLAGELRRVLARAALLQDGSRALDEFAQRLADPDLTAVARRLSAAWRLRAPGPDTFAGFGDTLRHIRETHIAARTKTLPVVYVAIAGWMLFALVAIVAVPAGTAFLHSLSSF